MATSNKLVKYISHENVITCRGEDFGGDRCVNPEDREALSCHQTMLPTYAH